MPRALPAPGRAATALLLNAMMERARSTAERRSINQNGGQNDAPQIRSATEK